MFLSVALNLNSENMLEVTDGSKQSTRHPDTRAANNVGCVEADTDPYR